MLNRHVLPFLILLMPIETKPHVSSHTPHMHAVQQGHPNQMLSAALTSQKHIQAESITCAHLAIGKKEHAKTGALVVHRARGRPQAGCGVP